MKAIIVHISLNTTIPELVKWVQIFGGEGYQISDMTISDSMLVIYFQKRTT